MTRRALAKTDLDQSGCEIFREALSQSRRQSAALRATSPQFSERVRTDPPASSSSAGAASDVKLTTSRSERRRRLRPAVAGAGSRSLHNSGQRGVHWNITVLEPSALVRMFETARCDPLFMQ